MADTMQWMQMAPMQKPQGAQQMGMQILQAALNRQGQANQQQKAALAAQPAPGATVPGGAMNVMPQGAMMPMQPGGMFGMLAQKLRSLGGVGAPGMAAPMDSTNALY